MCVGLAGCFDGESASPPAARAPGSDVSTQVAVGEWKAVIEDWYLDGAFDQPHRCLAIREALEQLPTRDYSAPRLHAWASWSKHLRVAPTQGTVRLGGSVRLGAVARLVSPCCL